MPTTSFKHRRLWISALTVALYLVLSLSDLDRWPPVGEDEAWTAAAPLKLATDGSYASDLFAGYFGSEAGLYHLNPLYHLMLAGVFKVAGSGVVQMRLLPVLLGLGTLLLVLHIGRTLFDDRTALLAAALLLLLRLAVPEYGTGIPLLDIARVNRPDIAVPFFGLAAFALFIAAERSGRTRLYFLCGALVAFSSLGHLYGAFWLPALIVAAALHHGTKGPTYSGFVPAPTDPACHPEPFGSAQGKLSEGSRRIPRRYVYREILHLRYAAAQDDNTCSGSGNLLSWRAAMLMVAGFAVVWLPVILWLVSNREAFVGQSSMVAGRFDLLSPSFYMQNVLNEFRRFGVLHPFDGSSSTGWLRPGLWSVAVGLPAALFTLYRHRGDRTVVPSFTVAVVLILQAFLFALLLSIKFFNYFIALWPLVVLLLAWLVGWWWEHRTGSPARVGLAVLLALVIVEGSLSIVDQRRQAQLATPYDLFEGKIASELPDGVRVLGLNRYWLGLRQYDYRSWLVPILLSDPLHSDTDVPLDSALERISPDVILMDQAMRDYFAEVADTANPRHAHHLGLQRFFARHSVLRKAVVEDETYGRMEILHLSR